MKRWMRYAAIILGLALLLTAPAWDMAQAAETEIAAFSPEANVQFLRDNGVEPEQIARLDADTINSVVMQARANRFTPLQIQQMAQGLITVPSKLVGNAEVTLPAFKVTLNGVQMDNAYSQYPLIVHRDITYFPMTYYDCRFLGIETQWTDYSAGLFIETTGVTAAYNPYTTKTKNGHRHNAIIPGFPVTVNGRAINNLAEEYPLLVLRDVTYFPLTWRFAVDEFGWEYSFDESDGLIINSDNIKLEQSAVLPERAPGRNAVYDDAFSSQAVVVGGYVYYEGTQGRIMQAPLSDTSRSRMVYQLPDWTYGDSYVYPTLYSEDGQALLRYHQGGATMGTDYMIRLNADGTTTELSSSRSITRTFGDKTFNFWVGPMPGSGTLRMKVGAGEYEQVGSPDYLYGWAWRSDEGSSGGIGVDRLYLIGDELYILAFDRVAREADLEAAKSNANGDYSLGPTITNGIYKVNIKTDAVTRVVDREVFIFQKDGDYLYYPSDGSIYRYSLRDGKEELLGTLMQAHPVEQVGQLMVLNGRVYWQDPKRQTLYDLAGNELNPGATLTGMALAGDDLEYLVCSFEETATSRYRVMIFDKNGAVVFKTSDRAFARNVTIEGKNLYFCNLTTGTVCRGVLP